MNDGIKSVNDDDSKPKISNLRMKTCVMLHWKFFRHHRDQRRRKPRVLTSAPILASVLPGCRGPKQMNNTIHCIMIINNASFNPFVGLHIDHSVTDIPHLKLCLFVCSLG